MQMTRKILRHEKSVTEVIKTFNKFPLFSGFKINNAKCEIAGIGVKTGVKMGLCGIECIDLTNDVIKILGIKNFLNHIVKMENILKLPELRNLTIEGRSLFLNHWQFQINPSCF